MKGSTVEQANCLLLKKPFQKEVTTLRRCYTEMQGASLGLTLG